MTERNDQQMMQSPGQWPNWPLLPGKRPDPRFSNGGRGTSFKQFGLMVAVDSRMLHVYLARMDEIDAAPGATVGDALDTVDAWSTPATTRSSPTAGSSASSTEPSRVVAYRLAPAGKRGHAAGATAARRNARRPPPW